MLLKRVVAAVLVVFSVATLLWGLGYARFGPFEYWFYPIIMEFCYGAVLGAVYLSGFRLKPGISFTLIGLSFVLAVLSVDVSSYNLRFLVWGIPSLVFVSAMALTEEWHTYKSRFWRGFQIVGEGSYTLYLSHPFVITAMILVWAPVVGDGRLSQAAYVIVALAAAVLYAVLAFFVIERPMTRFVSAHMWPEAGTRASIRAAPGS